VLGPFRQARNPDRRREKMPSTPKPRSIQKKDKMSEAYCLFFKLFFEKFLRASGIWGEFFTDREGKSFYGPIRDDPENALERLTYGKTDRLRRIMVEKFESALILWAIEKMGDDFEKYVSRGLEQFFTGVMLRVLGVGTYKRDGFTVTERCKTSFLVAVHKSLMYFPAHLAKEAGFPFDRFTEIKREYDSALARASKLKRKRWYNSVAYTLALIENFPGTSRDKAESYRFMKPSQIALDYVRRKYKLPLGIESIKKYLHLKRIPQDLWDMELKRIATPVKRHSPALL
jgi:hypothetical protein